MPSKQKNRPKQTVNGQKTLACGPPGLEMLPRSPPAPAGMRNNWPDTSLTSRLLLLVARKGAKFDVINASLPNRKLLAGRLSPSCFEFLPSLLLLDTSIWLVCIYKNPIVLFSEQYKVEPSDICTTTLYIRALH